MRSDLRFTAEGGLDFALLEADFQAAEQRRWQSREDRSPTSADVHLWSFSKVASSHGAIGS